MARMLRGGGARCSVARRPSQVGAVLAAVVVVGAACGRGQAATATRPPPSDAGELRQTSSAPGAASRSASGSGRGGGGQSRGLSERDREAAADAGLWPLAADATERQSTPRPEGTCNAWCADGSGNGGGNSSSDAGEATGALPSCDATLRLAVAMPYSQGVQRSTRAASALLACQHARELDASIVGNATVNALRAAGLRVECGLYDTQFSIDGGINAALESVVGAGSHAIVGAARSAVTGPMAEIASFFGALQVSHASTASSLAGAGTLFGRTVVSDSSTAAVTASLVRRVGWQNVAFFAPNDAYGTGYTADFAEAAEELGIKILVTQLYESNSNVTAASVGAVLDTILRTRATIVVAIMFDTDADTIFRLADDRGMLETGYAWVTSDGLTSNALSSADDPARLSERMAGLLRVAADPTLSPNFNALVEARQVAPTCIYLGNATLEESDTKALLADDLSDFAPYAYDAVWALALAAASLDSGLFDPDFNATARGNALYEAFLQTTFSGASAQVSFMSNGDRSTEGLTIAVTNWQVPNASANSAAGGNGTRQASTTSTAGDVGRFVLVGVLNETSEEFVRTDEPVVWPGGSDEIPADLKPLPSSSTSNDNTVQIAVGVTVGVVILLLLLLVGFLLYRRRREKPWVIKYEELVFEDPPVVLGQGAHGEVLKAFYHGTPVAVKGMLSASSDGSGPFERSASRLSLAVLSRTTMSIDETSGGVCRAPLHMLGCASGGQDRRMANFEREIELLVRLRHPHIVAMMGVATPPGSRGPSLVMELMEQGSLRAVLDSSLSKVAATPSVSLKVLLGAAANASAGLRYLHAQDPPVVHADIKCANIMIDSKFTAKLGDFGLSSGGMTGPRRRSGGTPLWIAPELINRDALQRSAEAARLHRSKGDMGSGGASGSSGALARDSSADVNASARSSATIWAALRARVRRDAVTPGNSARADSLGSLVSSDGSSAGGAPASALDSTADTNGGTAAGVQERGSERARNRRLGREVQEMRQHERHETPGVVSSKEDTPAEEHFGDAASDFASQCQQSKQESVTAGKGTSAAGRSSTQSLASHTSDSDSALPNEAMSAEVPSGISEAAAVQGQTIAMGAIAARDSCNTPASDVYSFGMCLYELVSKHEPYVDELKHMRLDELLVRVSDPADPLRPCAPPWDTHAKQFSCPMELLELMSECWHQNPLRRPSAAELHERLEKIHDAMPEPPPPPMDAGRRLLSQFGTSLPGSMTKALQEGRRPDPVTYDCCSVVFSDIKGFTKLSASMTPEKVDAMVERLFVKFEAIAADRGVTKIDTIGDCFVAVAGLPKVCRDHALRATEFAHDCADAAAETLVDEENAQRGAVQVRFGINTGPVVAGVTGGKFTIYGDTVNVAARMEALSSPGKVNVAARTRQALLELCGTPRAKQMMAQRLHERGKLKVKLEEYPCWWLDKPPISSRSVLESQASTDSIPHDDDAEEDGAHASGVGDASAPRAQRSLSNSSSKRGIGLIASIRSLSGGLVSGD